MNVPSREIQQQLEAASKALRNGDAAGCARRCDRLLREQPGLLPARYLRGLVAMQRKQSRDAIEDLRFVWKAQPGNLHAAFYLGRSLRQAERYEEAVKALSAARSQPELEVDAAYEMARCRTRLRQPGLAMEDYACVLERYPEHADAAANLAFLLERDNRLEESERWAARALELAPDNTIALLAKATLERRRGELDAASARLRGMLRQTSEPINRSIVLNQLGQCLERQERHEQAFEAFSKSNLLLQRNHPYGRASATGSYGLETVDAIRSWLRHNPPQGWSEPPASGRPDPAFLLGFPRSGTTLLDQALSAHSKIEVLEEVELFSEVRKRWVENDGLQRLPGMSALEIRQARGNYWRALDAHRTTPDKPLVVDKLPLNLVYLFLIHRLFPRARVLFILRDPRDVCISCYFQSFDLQGAMPYFLDLADTVTYYDRVMALASESFEALDNPRHTIRYEDLVTDFEGTMQAAISFLGHAWDPAVLDYRTMARARQIDTPSYQQVTQPLYTRSIGRWRNHSARMEPQLSILGQWIERFGY